jgi:hypothetical protein
MPVLVSEDVLLKDTLVLPKNHQRHFSSGKPNAELSAKWSVGIKVHSFVKAVSTVHVKFNNGVPILVLVVIASIIFRQCAQSNKLGNFF